MWRRKREYENEDYAGMVMGRMRREEKEDEERRVMRRGRAEQRFFCERRARKAQLQASRRGAHAERAASPPRHELIAWSRPPVGGKQEEGAERGGIRMRGREEEDEEQKGGGRRGGGGDNLHIPERRFSGV